MSGNSGAWGIALYQDGKDTTGDLQAQEQGISLSGGDAVEPYLPTTPLGYLTVPPEGLGVPPVRSGDVAFAQRDGVVQFADYYEPRQITLEVEVKNDDCPGCNNAPQIDAALVLDGVSPGRATTPDKPALDITGDLEITTHAALDDWTPASQQALVGKWVSTGNQRSYLLTILAGGGLRLFWSPDGITTAVAASSTVAPSVADGAPLWVRATLDVDNGAGGRTIRFYTSPDGVVWTQLGADVVQAGVTSIFSGSAELSVGARDTGGSDRMAGEVFYAEVRSGIGGTIVASPDFDQPPYTTSFTDAQGNVWTVISPAYLQPFVAEKMSARKKVSRLTQEWSRNCTGATLVIFSDCHDPDATEEEKVYLGPYFVHGRPRVAEVTWRRSDIGGATVLLRFDAADARLVLGDTIPGALWTTQHVQSVEADQQNLAPDPDLSSATMTLNGATVDDSYPQSGGPSGPDGGPYFRRRIITPNASSPMSMALTGTGTSGYPVDPGDVFSVGWWARKSPGGGPAPRLDWSWYTAAGALISNHNGAAGSVGADWSRVTQENIVAPALAEFVQWRLVWTGTALADQVLDFAQVWINEGAIVTEPLTVEVVGTLCVYPEITLFPEMTAPIVVTYGNHQFTYTEDIPIGTVVTVDTKYGRASDGFVDVTANIEGDFSSPLEPGVHDVTVQTGDPTDTGFVNVVWENAVVSG